MERTVSYGPPRSWTTSCRARTICRCYPCKTMRCRARPIRSAQREPVSRASPALCLRRLTPGSSRWPVAASRIWVCRGRHTGVGWRSRKGAGDAVGSISFPLAFDAVAVPRYLVSSERPVGADRHTIPSGPREVARQLSLEFGEVTRDHRGVEASKNRLLRLAVEQEAEGRLETAFRRMLPGCQPLAHLSRYRHVVTGLTLSFT